MLEQSLTGFIKDCRIDIVTVLVTCAVKKPELPVRSLFIRIYIILHRRLKLSVKVIIPACGSIYVPTQPGRPVAAYAFHKKYIRSFAGSYILCFLFIFNKSLPVGILVQLNLQFQFRCYFIYLYGVGEKQPVIRCLGIETRTGL